MRGMSKLFVIILAIVLVGCLAAVNNSHEPVVNVTNTPKSVITSLRPTTTKPFVNPVGTPDMFVTLTVSSAMSPSVTTLFTPTLSPTVAPSNHLTELRVFTPTVTPTLTTIDESTSFHVERVFDTNCRQIAVSPDGSLIAIAQDEEFTAIYSYKSGEYQRHLQKTNVFYTSRSFTMLAFSPDSRLLAMGGLEEIIWIWDVIEGQLIYEIPFFGEISDMVFSSQGNLLAVTSPNPASYESVEHQGIGVIDLEVGRLIAERKRIQATSVSFAAEDDTLVIGASDYSQEPQDFLLVWHYETDTLSNILIDGGRTSYKVETNQQAGTMVAAVDASVHLFDLTSWHELHLESLILSQLIRRLQFDDHDNIYAMEYRGQITKWDADGNLIIKQHPFPEAVDFSIVPNTDNLLVCFPDKVLEIAFDEAACSKLCTAAHHPLQ